MLRAGAPSLAGLLPAARLHSNTAVQLLSPARDWEGSAFRLGTAVTICNVLFCCQSVWWSSMPRTEAAATQQERESPEANWAH